MSITIDSYDIAANRNSWFPYFGFVEARQAAGNILLGTHIMCSERVNTRDLLQFPRAHFGDRPGGLSPDLTSLTTQLRAICI